jgi:hypothetical protein
MGKQAVGIRMSRIIKKLYPEALKKTAALWREGGLLSPTFKQLQNPD